MEGMTLEVVLRPPHMCCVLKGNEKNTLPLPKAREIILYYVLKVVHLTP